MIPLITLLSWAVFALCWVFKLMQPRHLAVFLIVCACLSIINRQARLNREIPSPVPFPTLDEMTQIQPTR